MEMQYPLRLAGTLTALAMLGLTAIVMLEPVRAAERATICHAPPGNTGGSHTIIVGASAVSAHLAHGDSQGPCSGSSTEPPEGGGAVGASTFSVVLCDSREGESGRLIEVNEIGRAIVYEALCE
jgi:hypothetical protein